MYLEYFIREEKMNKSDVDITENKDGLIMSLVLEAIGIVVIILFLI